MAAVKKKIFTIFTVIHKGYGRQIFPALYDCFYSRKPQTANGSCPANVQPSPTGTICFPHAKMKGMAQWLAQNWFNLLSTVGIIGSLWIAIVTLRSGAKTQRISNLLAITANYCEIRQEFLRSPELARVVDPAADVGKKPVTPAEESFINMVISHTSSVYEALKDDLMTSQAGLRQDVCSFFSLPIPKAVWSKTKLLQNQDFAAFIDSSLKKP